MAVWFKNEVGLLLFICTFLFSNFQFTFGESMQTLYGTVGAGNYTFFTLKNVAPVKIVLTTRNGDADLYVSDVLSQPSYDFLEHNASSTSCGIDEVDITSDMARPVYIAVYGHPRYEVSDYSLDVVSNPDPYDHFSNDFSSFDDDETQRKTKRKSEQQEQTESEYSEETESYFKNYPYLVGAYRDRGDELLSFPISSISAAAVCPFILLADEYLVNTPGSSAHFPGHPTVIPDKFNYLCLSIDSLMISDS